MKHIGLVLSGGMGKGAYQIGALMALNEFFQPSDFEYVSAASIGVLNTYTYLTGNLRKAYDIWENVNLQGDKRFITSVLKSPFLQNIITEIISDVDIPNSFYIPLLDLLNRELNYYNLNSIPKSEIEYYLRASVAMPFYNKGISIDSKVLYDGAVVDNIPIFPVLKNNLDYVICIYFDDLNFVLVNHVWDSKSIKLTFPDVKILSNSVNIKHDSIMLMLEEGYQRTKRILSSIFIAGTDNLNIIYEKINEMNAEKSKKSIRLTGDVVVTNMNKLTKKIVRNKRIIEDSF